MFLIKFNKIYCTINNKCDDLHGTIFKFKFESVFESFRIDKYSKMSLRKYWTCNLISLNILH